MLKKNMDAVFVYSQDFTRYKFSPDHPFDSVRTKLTYQLLDSLGCLDPQQVISPEKASMDEILLAHKRDYVEFVQKVSAIGSAWTEAESSSFGLGSEENPIFPDLHYSASLITGGTLTGLKHILQQEGSHALNLSGGLHHASAGKASGFCVYNDINVAIAYLKKNYGYKILYVDTDAHHGDGVQWHFYDDPDVCTLSIHETGKYLFPGTGGVRERGIGQGYGFKFNLPLDAFTEDDSFQYVLANSLQNIAEYFQPDIIISQHGADAHFLDQFSHLNLTSESYRYIPQLIHQISHTYCKGKWLALGGGGYNTEDIVPRLWSFIWLEMNDLRDKYSIEIPQERAAYVPIPRHDEIVAANQKTLLEAMYLINKPKIMGYFPNNS